MSGLVYEVVWVRAVGLHLGTSTPAISLVTATFMAGLAAGNAWLGRRADHTSRPLELYARVELGIGIAGATVSLLLLRAGSLLDGVSRFAETLGPAAFAARALVLVSLLIVPTTLMGGTLPVVSRVIVRHGETGAAIGGIYAWNTFGAVAGVLLPDFWLIPLHGMTSAVWVAALGNAVVAASALWMARRNDEAASSVSATATTSTGPSTSTSTAVGPLPWLLTATSGFCGMALEVLFARTLSHWTSALVTSFAVLIAVYLITLAVGASLTRRAADRVPNPAARAAQLLALTGLAVLVELVFAPHWRTFERELWPRELRRPGLWFEACDALLHATYLEALPCLTMGAAFPFVARAFVREGAVGSSTGRLFTINTLAGTLGSLVAGFVWLAWLGAQRSYFAASALLLLPLMICSAQDRARSRLVAAGAGALAWLGLILTLPANHLRLTHFRGGGRITAVREGATTIAAAEQRYTFGSPSHMLLLTPGVSMSDTSFGARRYMAMMAHAAMLSAREPKRALLICYGVGNTARSLLSHEELQSLDVVDISPEVLSLAGEFAGAHGGKVPLKDPRTHVYVDDGRHHLVAYTDRYDVITAEPPPPNHAGVVNLYSRELYRLARQRLTAGGVITQWLPVFQLSPSDIRSMIAAFTAELPHTALLYGYSQELILIGGNAPLHIDSERVPSRQVQADLMHSGIESLADIAGAQLLNDGQLRRLVTGVEPLSDDRPSLQYPWESLSDTPSYALLFGVRESEGPQTPAALATRRALIALNAPATNPERDELAFGNAVARALAARPRSEALLALLGVEEETASLAARALSRPGVGALLALDDAAATAMQKRAERDVVHGAAITVARRAFYRGQWERALALLDAFAPPRGWLPSRELLAGTALRALGRSDAARQRLQHAAELSTDREAQRTLHALAEQAAQPLDADLGPFGLRSIRSRH